MIKVNTIVRDFDTIDDTITLDETDRHRRRMKMVSDGGIEFLLELDKARLLVTGEALQLEDGRVIAIVAAPEPLYIVSGQSAEHLLQLAWQIGNRHLPAQIFETHILIRHDHVIRDMLEGLGATVEETVAEFNPEGGAYGDKRHHHHNTGEHHHA